MPKVQRNNDENLIKSHYIYCIKRSNRPRINVLICEQCKYKKKCANYQIFKKDLTEEEANRISNSSWKVATVRKKKVKRIAI